MFFKDIALDAEGNTIVENGDLKLTTSNINFIVRELQYGRGSWDLFPYLGFGIDQYLGESLTEELINKIKNDISSYFQSFGIMIRTKIVKVDNHSIACRMNVVSTRESIIFVFDIQSGIVLFSDYLTVNGIESQPEEEKVPITNKYLKRR